MKRRTASDEDSKRVSHAAQAPAESPLPVHHEEKETAELAYRRWQLRGCPQGTPEEDWFEAERELASRNN